MATVAVYVSGHGFGHAVRASEVAAALLAQNTQVIVRSDAPAWLFPNEARYVHTERPIDVGVAQHDGLEMDVDQTRRRWRAFSNVLEISALREAKLLHEHQVDFVLGDIPPLAFAAARFAELPSAAVTNFGWDWIYGAWPDFEDAITLVQDAYSKADVLYRLPLHSTDADAFPAFKTIEDVPLIARHARRPRQEVRTDLGLGPDQRAVLLSFGAFGVEGLRLPQLPGVVFVVTPPLVDKLAPGPNVVRIERQPQDYVSLLAAADVVVTKPGYGIVADCLANHVAVLYTNRGPFREYEVLVAALHRHGRSQFIPREELLAGNVAPYLEKLAADTTPWTDQSMNGAQVIANRVQERLNGRGKAVT